MAQMGDSKVNWESSYCSTADSYDVDLMAQNCCPVLATAYDDMKDTKDNATLTLTLTFRPFSRRFYPKRLSISTFVRRKRNNNILLSV